MSTVLASPERAAWATGPRVRWLVVAWLAVAVGAFGALWKYKSTAGRVSGTIEAWPAASSLARASDRPTLVMLAHPYCPCTRASMTMLSQFLGRSDVRTRAYVVFAAWDDDDPTTSELWARASKLPNVTALVDRGGVEAAKFGATTSGHVILFDEHGKRLFSGGITGTRGHEGDNAGLDRLGAAFTGWAKGRPAEGQQAPTFGCKLEGE